MMNLTSMHNGFYKSRRKTIRSNFKLKINVYYSVISIGLCMYCELYITVLCIGLCMYCELYITVLLCMYCELYVHHCSLMYVL